MISADAAPAAVLAALDGVGTLNPGSTEGFSLSLYQAPSFDRRRGA